MLEIIVTFRRRIGMEYVQYTHVVQMAKIIVCQ